MINKRKWLIDSETPTTALARFAHTIDIASLTKEETQAAKRHLLDAIGACVAGVEQPLVRRATSLLEAISGNGDIPVAGLKQFKMMVAGHLSDAEADELIERVWTIEKLPSIRPLIDLLCKR